MYDLLNFKDQYKLINNITYTDYFYRLMLLARSVFKWNNLPNGLDEKWIERFLFYEGQCAFFHHDKLGYMVAKIAPSGELNYYDEPTIIQPHTNNCTGETFKSLRNYEDCILIKNNDAAIPTYPTLNMYALRLAEIQRTIDINVSAQKTPVLLVCSDKQRKSLNTMFDQWNGFKPAIYGDKSLDMENVKALKMDAPIVFDKLQIQKHSVWNEVMTFLGINNANMDKRERLVDDEVQANNEQIELSAQVALKARELACKQINKLFGLNISVELRNAHAANMEELEPPKEGDPIV